MRFSLILVGALTLSGPVKAANFEAYVSCISKLHSWNQLPQVIEEELAAINQMMKENQRFIDGVELELSKPFEAETKQMGSGWIGVQKSLAEFCEAIRRQPSP